MRTRIFYLGVCLMFLGISRSNAQNNTTTDALDASPGEANVRIGYQTGAALTSGSKENILIGNRACQYNTDGDNNTCVGYQSGKDIGYSAGSPITPGYSNSFFGAASGQGCLSGYYNTAIGVNSGNSVANGHHNTFLGQNSGFYVSGENNVILGSASGYDVVTSTYPSLNGNIVLSDGGGIVRMIFKNNGWAGLQLVGLTMPNNVLEIGTAYAVSGTAGLRFRNYTNASITPITNPDADKGVLSVNSNGDVILVKDQVGISGPAIGCSAQSFVPVWSNTLNQLDCSQIFDDGTSVGIGVTTGFNYTWPGGLTGPTSPPGSGTLALAVNGVTRALAYFATSDKRFKKDIKSIEDPLDIIMALDGKTYTWDKEFKEMNFDNGLHSGFLAQDLEKIIPHVVATDDTGMKSVNYIEIIPYLVEAIKTQQTQIEELKTQIADKFKSENTELINLGNTRIINISPNPSMDMMTVSFNIEKSVNSAKLLVHDLNGAVLNNLTINDRENNITRTLQKDNFGSGIYIVSLVINGKSVDTKKIVFN